MVWGVYVCVVKIFPVQNWRILIPFNLLFAAQMLEKLLKTWPKFAKMSVKKWIIFTVVKNYLVDFIKKSLFFYAQAKKKIYLFTLFHTTFLLLSLIILSYFLLSDAALMLFVLALVLLVSFTLFCVLVAYKHKKSRLLWRLSLVILGVLIAALPLPASLLVC